jgi:prenyltransferase beta subunit
MARMAMECGEALGNCARLPWRYKLWRPAHLSLIVKDLRGIARQREHDHETHLRAALDWLCRAQDRRDGCTDEGGVSAGWSFEDGWLPSYPETSGYIVETFLAAATLLQRSDLIARANRIIDWELTIQKPDGSFPGHFGEAGSQPVIFNTGQIMHGLMAAYRELGRDDCLEAALGAGRWMVKSQDPDGCWRRNVHNGIPHTYNTRAAWALIRVGDAASDSELRNAAVANFRWALSQQTASGWFANNTFGHEAHPFTHTIAYAIRGLLEGGLLCGDERFVDAAYKAATAIAQRQREDGWLTGAFADGWRSAARYCCLTGLAQMAINWLRLSRTYGERLAVTARRGVAYVKRTQQINGKSDPADGGIAGSAPIWGTYSRFEFPNWASKFFADALMMDMAAVIIPKV